MLSFNGYNLLELVNEISNLKLLRYLDLSITGITRLSDSICMLHNLETLILSWCPLTELPNDVYKLVNLRHLDMKGTYLYKEDAKAYMEANPSLNLSGCNRSSLPPLGRATPLSQEAFYLALSWNRDH